MSAPMSDTAPTIRTALNDALHAHMRRDPDIVLIGEDIGAGGGVFGVSAGLLDSFGPTRVMDTPISESAFVGMAVGASACGLKPVVEIMFCDFMGVCFDQILNQAAKMRFLSDGRLSLPLVIRTTMGAGDGSAAMHSQSLHGLVTQIPGLRVACPATAGDAVTALAAGLHGPDPLVMFEHRGLYGSPGYAVAADAADLPFGAARVARHGEDVTVVALSAMVAESLAAADCLKGDGISAEVIDLRTASPIDGTTVVDSVGRTGRLLVVDGGSAFGGVADAVVSLVARRAFAALKAPPATLTPPHTPVPYARELETAWLPSADAVSAAVRALMAD